MPRATRTRLHKHATQTEEKRDNCNVCEMGPKADKSPTTTNIAPTATDITRSVERDRVRNSRTVFTIAL